MPSQAIAISVGAGHHQLPLILELQNRGFKVAAFDMNPASPGASAADYFASISSWDAPAAIQWLESLNCPFVGAFCYSYGKALTTQLELINNFHLHGRVDPQLVNLSHDKVKQRAFLRDADLTQLEDIALDLPQASKHIQKEARYLIKDRLGGSSHGIRRIQGDELIREFEGAPETFSDLMAQMLLEGDEYRVIAAVQAGRLCFSAALKRQNLAETFICAGYQTLSSTPASIQYLTDRLLKAINQDNYFLKIDLLDTAQGIEVIEFDLGKPGDYFEPIIAPRLFDLDFTNLYIDLYLGEKIKQSIPWQAPAIQGYLDFLYSHDIGKWLSSGEDGVRQQLSAKTGSDFLLFQAAGDWKNVKPGPPQSNMDVLGVMLRSKD